MGRKRNSRGQSKRSPASKTNSELQIPSIKDLTLQDGPVHSEIPALHPEHLPPGQSHLDFPDSVYVLAAAIFQNNYLEKPAAHRLVNYGKRMGLPLPEVRDEEMHRAAYELAFNTLKYQELLEDIMIDSCFCLTQPMPDDQMSLVAVMLCDFQDRKFIPWECQREEESVQEVRDVKNCLLRFKTKLAASLARCRIKHDLLTIDCILPESVKTKQERSSRLPLYAWVNTLKSSLDDVQSVLRTAGFSQVESIGQLAGHTFCQDLHCGDTLVFPAQLKAELYRTKLLGDHKLIMQDKSCSLGPNAVCSLLLGEGDVLMAGCFSGLTVAHTASLIAVHHNATTKGQSKIYVCVGNCTAAQREELQEAVASMGCKNVKLLPEDFQCLNGGDTRLQKVRVILLTPQCSVSAISNPVDFILQENGDTDLLQDLSQGSIAQSKLQALVAQQKKNIDHALKFPKVLAVVYSTCSSYSEENEEVVSRALEEAKARSEQEGEPKLPNFRPSPSFPSSSGLAEGSEFTGPFFTLEPSEQSNGCFLAVVTREPEPVVEETPQEVLARANAKGLLDRIGSNQPTRKERHGNTNRMTKTTRACPSQSQPSIRTQSRVNQLHRSETKISQQFADRRLSPRGKPSAPCLPASKNTALSSTPCRSMTRVNNPATSSTSSSASTLHPAPVASPRRARQEAPRPVALTLPSINFPSFLPSQDCPLIYNKWKAPAQSIPLLRYSRGLSKEAAAKPRPWF